MSNGFLSHLVQAFSITAPILFVMVLGLWFRQRDWIDANFVAVSNRLIFNIVLPIMLFLATATSPLAESLKLSLVVFAALCILGVTAVAWSIAPTLAGKQKRGAFTQSVYRSNMGMIGLALCLSAYGDEALARAAITRPGSGFDGFVRPTRYSAGPAVCGRQSAVANIPPASPGCPLGLRTQDDRGSGIADRAGDPVGFQRAGPWHFLPDDGGANRYCCVRDGPGND